MYIPAAYLTLILIWSTTPIAMKWSVAAAGVMFAASARATVAALCVVVVLLVVGGRMLWHRAALQTYGVTAVSGALSLFLVCWAIQWLPSGWISTIYGLTPILTALLSIPLLKEETLSPLRWLALIGAVLGLAIVFAESLALGPRAWLGIVATFAGMVTHACTMVFIRRFDAGLAPLPATVGSLMLTAPLLGAASLTTGTLWPATLGWRDWGILLYLGAIGTCAGYVLYFSLLQRIGPTRLALVQVVTPVVALLIGHVLDGEPLSPRIWTGALLIIAALGAFEYRAIIIDTGALEGLILQPARLLRDAGARWRGRRNGGE